MEFLETGGTLLVIVFMMWVGIQLAVRAERYTTWKRGTTSRKTTVSQLAMVQSPEYLRETYVDFADLARQA
jgi:hypothetical protein